MPKGIYNRIKKVGEETRQKMRIAKLGIKNHNYGKKMSDEQKLKLSLAKIGKPSNNKGRKYINGGFWMGKKRPELSGENSNLWKGGITPINKTIRNSPEYKEWRKSVFERDNYTCQISGEVGGDLVVHHIKNFSSVHEDRFNIDNGITLNRFVHYAFHSKYGKFNNTAEQIKEYKELLNLNYAIKHYASIK